MGFATTDCISQESHFGDFTCAVCFQLPDLGEAVLTSCSHVFCKNCLNNWMRSQNQTHEEDLSQIQTCPCPSCKSTVRISECKFLREGNPLAFRLFGRIQVKCPLDDEKCKWIGDYSEFQLHLTSSSDHIGGASSDTSAAERTAKALKEQANEKFLSRNYKDAILLYNKAISVCPDKIPELYANRAVTLFYLREFEQCFSDCKKAVQLNPKYPKAIVRGARAAVELGRFSEAREFLVKGSENFTDAIPPLLAKERQSLSELLGMIEEGKALSMKGDHGSARKLFSQLLQRTSARQVMVLAAEEECMAGNTERALRLTLQVLRLDKSDTSALLTRSKAMYLNGDLDDSLTIVKEVLRLSPDERGAQVLFKSVKNLKKILEMVAKASAYSEKCTTSYGEAVVMLTSLLQDTSAKALLTSENEENSPLEKWDPRLEEKQEWMNGTVFPTIPKTSPLAIQLYAERANALFRLKLFTASLQDCAHAIYHKDDCKRAWLTKAYTLLEMGEAKRAVDELTPLVQERWGQNDSVIQGVYEKAKFEVRKANRPDYYDLLGVSSLASEPEIKSGYKRKAMVYHPDKLGPEVDAKQRQVAESTFKLLGEGLEILTDTFKRSLYDQGFDKEAIEERVQRAHKAARR